MFCFGLLQTHGCKVSASWISLTFVCSMVCMWTSVDCWSYHYSNFSMNWQEARTWCRERYTDLVVIQNQEEILHLINWLPKKPTFYWIGLRKTNHVWTWVATAKALTAEESNWATGEPNNGISGRTMTEESCVEMYIRSLQNGKWNDERCAKLKTALCYTVFKCNKDNVMVPDHGSVNCTHEYGEFFYDSLCQYSCEEGYRLSMPRPLRCTASESWSDQPPTCELVRCPVLSHPQRGSVKCSHPLGPSSYQSTCVFTCDKGYVLSGSRSDTLKCEGTGNWNASQPSCTWDPSLIICGKFNKDKHVN